MRFFVFNGRFLRVAFGSRVWLSTGRETSIAGITVRVGRVDTDPSSSHAVPGGPCSAAYTNDVGDMRTLVSHVAPRRSSRAFGARNQTAAPLLSLSRARVGRDNPLRRIGVAVAGQTGACVEVRQQITPKRGVSSRG